MRDDIASVEGFEHATIIGYTARADSLELLLRNWNEEEIRFLFEGVCLVRDRDAFGSEVQSLQELRDSSEMEEAVELQRAKEVSEERLRFLRHFRFTDLDSPASILDIVCTRYTRSDKV